LKERGLKAAGRIAAKSGARLFCDTFTARVQRGAGRVKVERIPYFAEQIVEFLQDLEQLILVGSKPPVSFFAYPGKPSWCTPETTEILYLTHAHEDGTLALEAVADAIGAPKEPALVAPLKRPDSPAQKFDQYTIGQVIARYLPDNAILSDEGATSGGGTGLATQTAGPHDHLGLTGGSIGQGIPLATGAAVRGAGSQGGVHPWRRRRDVHAAGAVDPGTREAGCDDGHFCQPLLRDPEHRARPGRRRKSRGEGALDARPAQSRAQLDEARRRHGRRRLARRQHRDFEDQFSAAMKKKGPRLIEVLI
jgi:thiamine pyrophosphate-dependent acetolactate synthase large subunit-like protein